ncbi:hypothetical protein HK097_004844 [Rhizophlyctis rosea]|uniref:Uncharacterized protein n=1 Tax=Rhizophlyctis rosea TaxID=64517 RepID=A0AAD5SDT1_9FUNG|nr:hypothetical protein HK097_004844 [Rhizophlyctis rosea]
MENNEPSIPRVSLTVDGSLAITADNGGANDDGLEAAGRSEIRSQRRRTMFRGDSADDLLNRFASLKVTSCVPGHSDSEPSDGFLAPSLQSSASLLGNRSAPNLASIADVRSESVGTNLNGIAEGREYSSSEYESADEGFADKEASNSRSEAAHAVNPANLRLSRADVQRRANIAAAIDAATSSPVPPGLLSPQHSFLLTSPLSSAGGINPLDEALLSLNLAMFWQWVLCFCVVNFDLELGQALEHIYPPIDFSEDEKKNMYYSDSSSYQLQHPHHVC